MLSVENLKSEIENSNDLLLSLLAAGADDESIVRAMSSSVFGLTGEVGPKGFGATTLEGHLVLFTHPEFYQVAGLPPDLEAVEATARQVAEYAKAVDLFGFVVNPGTHQRFVAGDVIERLHHPLKAPDAPTAPPLLAWHDPAPAVVEAVRIAAEASMVQTVWLASGPAVVTYPHPDPAFEAGLLARDLRMRSFAAKPEWAPVFQRDAPDRARFRLGALPHPLDKALVEDLRAHARIHRLEELWAFQASIGGEEPGLALAYAPHPHDGFARDFDVLHQRHHLGDVAVPLLPAEDLREALPRFGTQIL